MISKKDTSIACDIGFKPGSKSRRAEHAHLVCVIPMYNEATHARRFLFELYEKLAEKFSDINIIVVDDGSKDATVIEVVSIISDGLPVRLIRLSRNFGKEIALTAGLKAIESLKQAADVVLIMDSDFQHPFSIVYRMIERWEAGIDMVYGVQIRRNKESALRKAFTKVFYSLLTSSRDRVSIPPDAGDFRLMDQRVVRAINQMPERNRFMKGLYAWVGFSSEGVPFEALPRAGGNSSYGFRQLSELALNGITAFTSWPLRVASICGVVISLAVFLYGSWIVIERIWIGQPIPGFATLAAALMFFSGLQLMSIGLVGEYMGRVFIEVKGRPLYIIAEEIKAERDNNLSSMPAVQENKEDR